jgi:hypothetical protein
VTTRKFVSKNLPPVPVWFCQESLDPAEGWVEGKPTKGKRILQIRSVLYSDSSSLCWYRMAAVKKKLKQHKKKLQEEKS